VLPTVSAAVPPIPQNVGRMVLKTQASPCIALGDTLVFTFGDHGGMTMGLNSGTAAQCFVYNCGPVVLGPGVGHTFILHAWFPGLSTTAMASEIEVGWWEN